MDGTELTYAMDIQTRSSVVGVLPDMGMAVKSIGAFWLLYMVVLTSRAAASNFPDFWGLLLPRGAGALVGAGLTFLVYLALRPLARMSLPRKAILAGLICLPAAAAYAACNYGIYYVIGPLDAADMTWKIQTFGELAAATMSWYFLFAAWTAVYVAMSYAVQLRASDRRAAIFERAAQESQLRALRYQINPHFLFNTLNSISSLIITDKKAVAERMILNLSTFFRNTLSADPTADVSLEEEIKLQRLYLDIEQVRFPKRLKLEIDIPDRLRNAQVPVLILQPIVENAIKYGVARTRRPVTLRISAYEEAGRLHLKVNDDGMLLQKEPPEGVSTGVGLVNVSDRLEARYGAQAHCRHGPDPEGGFTVHLDLPVVYND